MLLSGACSASGVLAGFDREEVLIGGEPWLVAVADDPAERAQGLMGVTDLGAVRGMLFVFPDDTTAGFWMKDTLVNLDIAFFAADGSPVGGPISMFPCGIAPICLTHRPDAPYRYALEVPAGGFTGVADLRLDPASVGGG